MTDVADAMAGSGGPIGRIGRLPLLAPLRLRDFRLVWFGESISLLGDQFHYVALSWLVLGITGSGLALGTVLLAASLPRGAFLLVGGALSDRISPRSLMFGSNLVRAVITTAIAVLVLGERIEIWHLVFAGAIFGTVDAVFFPAIGTIVARLVPEERLGSANAVLQGTQQLMGTVGPAAAGFAIAIIGVGAAFVVDAISFAVAAVAIWLVRRVGVPEAGPETGIAEPVEQVAGPVAPTSTLGVTQASSGDTPHRGSVIAEMVEGARVVLGDPVMRALVLLSTSFNLAFTGPVVVGLPWLVQVRFDGDAALLGLLFAAFGGGSLIGVLLAGVFARPRRLGWLVLGVAILLGIGLATIGLVEAPVVGVICLLIGIGTGYINVSIITWTQVRTEPHLLGRTMSFLMLGSVVGAPVSLAIAGAVVDVQATALFLGAGILVVATALVGIATSLPRRMV